MEIKKDLQEFNKRWGIIEDSTYGEEFIKFKKRVLNILLHIDEHVSNNNISLFCQILGIQEKWESGIYGDYSEIIINELIKENTEKEFYRLIHIIFNYLEIGTLYRESFIKKLSDAIELSNVNLAITSKNGKIILYPKGETALDKILVNEVLSFLNDESQKHFVDALNSYLNFSRKNAIKSAESIRRSLEEFLRFKLKNKKGLKENLVELQKRHKAKNRDPILRNIIFQIFSYLDTYFNENSKHKDGNIDEPENEFLIYQSGLLMRYIHKIIP